MFPSIPRTIILVILVGAALAPPVRAVGSAEQSSLEALDRLMEGGDGSAALEEIARLTVKYPDLWLEMAPRLNTVLKKEERLNAAVGQVLASLDSASSPQEIATALERLEALSPTVPPGSPGRYSGLVSSVRGLVAHRAASDEYDRIEAASRASIAGGRYGEAVSTLLQGARTLIAMGGTPAGDLVGLVAAAEKLVASGSATIADAEKALALTAEPSADVLAVLQELFSLGATLRRARIAALPRTSAGSPALGYAAALVGSVGSAVERLCASVALRSCQEILARAEPELARIAESYDSPTPVTDVSAIALLRDRYLTGLRASAYLVALRAPSVTAVPLALGLQQRAMEADAYGTLAIIRRTAGQSRETPASSPAGLAEALAAVVETVASVRILADRLPSRAAVIASVLELGYDVRPLLDSARALDRRVQATLPFLASAEDSLSVTAVSQAQGEVDVLARDVQELGTAVRELADSKAAPDRGSLDLLDRETQRLAAELSRYEATWSAMAPKLTRRRDIARVVSRASELVGLVDQHAAALQRLESRRLELAAGLADWREEVPKRMASAREGLLAGRFEQARQDLIAAQGLLDRILVAEKNAELLAVRDVEVPKLYEEASRKTTAAAVRDVRAALDRGRAAFLSRDNATAGEQFAVARRLWARLTTLGNQEITSWTGLALAATDIQDRLLIPPTHPRSREVLELYAQALAQFQTGEQQLKQNKTRDALTSFRDADALLTRIRRIFPYHRDARTLSLRIVQVSDQQRFSLRLSSEIRSAEAKIDSAPEEAYFDMKVLQQIAPENETVKKRVAELEAKLGLLLPQATQKDRDQASDLRRQAAGAAPAQAYALLDKAVALNLTDPAATAAKDRLLAESDLLVGTLLGHDAQLAYETALALKDSERRKALEIVEGLLMSARNARFAPLLELQRELKR